MTAIHSIPAWKTKRKILGMSAILLPFLSDAANPSPNDCSIDWNGFRGHVTRTLEAGLIPAVNMDTGYANLIDAETRDAVLRETEQLCDGRRFVAGAYGGDQPGSRFAADEYLRPNETIQKHARNTINFQTP